MQLLVKAARLRKAECLSHPDRYYQNRDPNYEATENHQEWNL